ncbi:hypothetical protein [Geminicoccus roseus]|uniref:hypothetical protein n=1 Tax=Geminicoccus roseus TaxID=404900 RepID=UPI0003F8AEA2|nr:hypothetical protein [Geminicoccus roseus]
MAAPWDPPGFVFRPTGAVFRPAEADQPDRALPGMEWDGDALAMLAGKSVFIGVTFHDQAGDEYDRTQFGGTIVAASEEHGVTVQAPDGEQRQLPPWPGNYRPAPPGIHRARQADLEMVDPDLVCFWELHEVAGDG